MTKTFKKNDAVLIISLWSNLRIANRTGAVESQIQYYIQRATVMSAGKKQMHLIDATTGACLGSNFAPEMYQGCRYRSVGGFCQMMVVPATLSDDEAVELARRATLAYQAHEVSFIANRNDNKDDNCSHARYIRAWNYAVANTPVLEPKWIVSRNYKAERAAEKAAA